MCAEVLRSLRIRFTRRVSALPGRPDLLGIEPGQWAIFVHGCFWHSHRNCRRAMIPINNATYWRKKFAGNVSRDAKVTARLRRMGYRVLVLWECELKTPKALRRTRRFFR